MGSGNLPPPFCQFINLVLGYQADRPAIKGIEEWGSTPVPDTTTEVESPQGSVLKIG